MYEASFLTLIVIFLVALIAKTYGSVFGGGSFLVQPVMLSLGIPPHLVVANDIASSSGVSLSGAYVFHNKGHAKLNAVWWWLPGIIIGPIVGAKLLTLTPAPILEKLVAVFCLLGAGYILFFRNRLERNNAHNALPQYWQLKAVVISCLVGIYFGFSSAGGGAITSLVLFSMFGLSLHTTLGTQKFIHLPLHCIAGVTYYFLGLIHWPIFIALFLGCLVAGWLGSTLVLKIPEQILKPIFFSVILLLSLYAIVKGI